MIKQFVDRREGGKALAAELADYNPPKDAVILALPRGGVPVAFEVARELKAPLDIILVRKLGVPGQEELGFGAIASGGITIFNESLVGALKMPDSMIQRIIEREEKELERREKLYRRNRPPLNLKGKTVIIVDDGLATGATMRAGLAAVKTQKPKQIIVAAPVASSETCNEIINKSDYLCICAMTPEPFYGVGFWYRNFDQTSDVEVIELLEKAQKIKAGSMAVH
jgi:putative phosphoribosyl transferase